MSSIEELLVWGEDADVLDKLKLTHPNAIAFMQANKFQCHTPLWDLKPDGSYVLFGTDEHRYVCGAPLESNVRLSICAACAKLLNIPSRIRIQ